jgi:hypothetical protein
VVVGVSKFILDKTLVDCVLDEVGGSSEVEFTHNIGAMMFYGADANTAAMQAERHTACIAAH